MRIFRLQTPSGIVTISPDSQPHYIKSSPEGKVMLRIGRYCFSAPDPEGHLFSLFLDTETQGIVHLPGLWNMELLEEGHEEV